MFTSTFSLSAFTFGGGYAAIPLIQNQIVDVHHLMIMGEFADLITIAEITPGPISINSATFVGNRLDGVPGALLVYIISSVIEGSYLFMTVGFMMIINFITGLLTVTSYNIRISSTQNHIPNELRRRFNGTFQMILTLGRIIGQLMAGTLGEFFPIRPLILIANIFCIIATLSIMYRGRKHVKLIYNRDA